MAEEETERLPEWPALWCAAENDKVELVESEGHAAVRKELDDARLELQKANEAVLAMRNKIAELKTYKVEPKCVEVIHAAFVLLGTDPKEVADWNEVRRRLSPEFFNGLTSFGDTARVASKKTEEHVDGLLSVVDPESVKQASEALLSLYNWVVAGRKLMQETAEMPLKLRELAGRVPEELTGDLWADYESVCLTHDLAPHPHLLPKAHCKRVRAEEAAELEATKDPKAKGKPDPSDEDDKHKCTHLKVSGLQLDVGSMFALAKVLPACKTLTHLDLWSADLDTATFSYLTNVLPSTSVTTLSLDWSIRNLEAKSSSIGSLLEATKLTTLSLRSNGFDQSVIEVLSEHLCTNETLTSLDLSNNSLGDKGAAPLLTALQAPTSWLASLSLNACELSDEFVAGLVAQLGMREYSEEEIEKVELLKAQVEEITTRNASLKKGAEPEAVPTVPEMITDEQGRSLGAANRVLVEVMLGANQISLKGVESVCEMLKHNSAVKVLYLKHNDVTPEEELQVAQPRVFLSEAKALRDTGLSQGTPLLQELQMELAAAEPLAADAEATAILAAAVESHKQQLQEKIGAQGITGLGAIEVPCASMKAIVQAVLSILGEGCEVTEDWQLCCSLLQQQAPKDEEDEVEGQDEAMPIPSSLVLTKLLDADSLKGSFLDPEASLCARYYLDCCKWYVNEQGGDLRGGSFSTHVLEQYLVAVQTLADKEIELAVEAPNSEQAEVES